MSKLETNTTNLQSILETINNLPEAGGGLDTSDATATASDILLGKTAYVNGEKVTGKIYTVDQPAPSIIVHNSTGLITAKYTTNVGYSNINHTNSSTKQLEVRDARTITPGVSDQTISSGLFLTGNQTIKGDANLVAANIKSGVSIFGVIGTLDVGNIEGVDTSDATATASDIVEGKTAYANGQKITGTYKKPSGIASITTNGTHDIANYEKVVVGVSSNIEVVNTVIIQNSASGVVAQYATFNSAISDDITIATHTATYLGGRYRHNLYEAVVGTLIFVPCGTCTALSGCELVKKGSDYSIFKVISSSGGEGGGMPSPLG